MGTFEAKEGLFEYSIKRLGTQERREALDRVARSVPSTDESLKAFLNIGNHREEASADTTQRGQLADF